MMQSPSYMSDGDIESGANYDVGQLLVYQQVPNVSNLLSVSDQS